MMLGKAKWKAVMNIHCVDSVEQDEWVLCEEKMEAISINHSVAIKGSRESNDSWRKEQCQGKIFLTVEETQKRKQILSPASGSEDGEK